MSRPSPTVVQHGDQDWDASYDDNNDLIFITPIPLAEYASAGALPTASSYDRCVAALTDAGGGVPGLVISNGTSWRIIALEAAAHTDSSAATLAAFLVEFNAFLAKLRAANVIA